MMNNRYISYITPFSHVLSCKIMQLWLMFLNDLRILLVTKNNKDDIIFFFWVGFVWTILLHGDIFHALPTYRVGTFVPYFQRKENLKTCFHKVSIFQGKEWLLFMKKNGFFSWKRKKRWNSLNIINEKRFKKIQTYKNLSYFRGKNFSGNSQTQVEEKAYFHNYHIYFPSLCHLPTTIPLIKQVKIHCICHFKERNSWICIFFKLAFFSDQYPEIQAYIHVYGFLLILKLHENFQPLQGQGQKTAMIIFFGKKLTKKSSFRWRALNFGQGD